jgi:hypothetical protein
MMYSHRMETNLTKVTVNLIPIAVEDLAWLTEELKFKQTDLINRALQIYAFIERQKRLEGAELMFRYRDGELGKVHIL